MTPFRSAALLVTLASVLAPAPSMSGDSSPPVAAPGESLPKHAQGGWPTETSGDDRKPGRTPEQQEHLDAVTGDLQRTAKRFGPDSVVLQSKLMVRSMGAGAIGPTEVRVAGPATATAGAGPGHLEIDIETGLYFDERTTTPAARLETVWKDVAIPVLDEMVSFNIDPSALELVFLFDVQDTGKLDGSSLDPTEESRHEAFRVRLSRAVLEDMVADRLAGDAVREKAEFLPVAEVPKPPRSPR